jgi:hypothetical protein
MAERPPYRKATRRHRTVGGFTQLWIGDGHLLLVKSTRFTEEYRRFAFSSIQAFVVTELPFNFVPLAILALAAAAAVVWALRLELPAARVWASAPGALVLFGLLIHFVRGPRCRCTIHTAVSREPLEPVSRMRTARTLLARLTPEIEAAQGGALTPERAREVHQTGISPTGQPPDIPRPAVYIPEILFGLFLLDAALIAVELRYVNAELTSLLATTFPAEFVMAIYLLLAAPMLAGRRSRVISRIVAGLAILCMLVDAGLLINAGTNWIASVMDATRLGRPPTSAALVRWPAPEKFPYYSSVWRAAAAVLGLAGAAIERSRGERK